jgi:hypothetical protein
MTNKEGGPSTIASALTGLTPAYGLHLPENRRPEVLAEIRAPLSGAFDFGALGTVLGERCGSRIPLIAGIKRAGMEELKALSAALPTYGGPPIFHMEKITPEKHSRPREKTEITAEDIEAAKKELDDDADADFVLIGCPHCSLSEIKRISELLEGRRVKKEFWIATSRQIKEEAERLGYADAIEKAGARFACDTCHVVAPLKGRFRCVATNSSKGVFYGRSRHNFKTVFRPLEECVKIATGEDA